MVLLRRADRLILVNADIQLYAYTLQRNGRDRLRKSIRHHRSGRSNVPSQSTTDTNHLQEPNQ